MTIAQFVHIGDLHLHPGARQADRLRALDQVIKEGLALPHLAAWLFPGDVFDRRSTVEDRNALKDRVTRMADAAPVFGCYGNHDAPGDLDIFGDLGARNHIRFAAVPTTLRFAVPRDEQGFAQAHLENIAVVPHVTVFILPYPTESGLVGAGVPPAEVPQKAREALEAIMLDAGARLRKAQAKGDIVLMIGHVNVAGAVTSTGQPSIGQEIELDAALLRHLPPDCYVGLNHIHKGQAMSMQCLYAGSICRLNWGEIEPKRWLEVAYGADGGTFTVYEHPVAVAPMYHVEGEFDRTGFSWHVTDGPDGQPVPMPGKPPIGDPENTIFAGCEVRARMRYKQSEGIVLVDAQRDVRELFERMGCSRFEFEPVCVPDRGLRAPEVVLAKSLPEKLAAWARVANVVLPETAAAKVMALETRDADTVVAETEAAMAALLEEPDAGGADVQVVRREADAPAQPEKALLF